MPKTELDNKKLKQQTLNKTLQQPVTVYPTSAGVVAGAWILAFGLNPIALGVCAGGLALGVGGWLYEYLVRGDDHALKIMERFRRDLVRQRAEAIERIRLELEALGHENGLRQLQQLTAKFKNFETVLGKKLHVTEITYNRYLAISEQVFLNALDNLEQLAFGLQSISAIDMTSINRQLEKHKDDEVAQKPLLERAALWQQQHKRAEALMAENEHAMTQLDQVTTTLAQTRMRDGHAQMDMENAMAELEDLIKKTFRYQKK